MIETIADSDRAENIALFAHRQRSGRRKKLIHAVSTSQILLPLVLEEAAMDWNAAVENNREALRRILAALTAMAGLSGERPTLPRHLYRAVLRLLRPAESAVRRLVIVAARDLVVAAPIMSAASQRSKHPSANRRGATAKRPGATPARKARQTVPLLDPLRKVPRIRRTISNRDMPRIWCLGMPDPIPRPPLPAPDDVIDASSLGNRLRAIGRTLDTLPQQALRFARWRAARAAARKLETAPGYVLPPLSARRRMADRPWPMRGGRPPGARKRGRHDVDKVLSDLDGLALWALERRDTS